MAVDLTQLEMTRSTEATIFDHDFEQNASRLRNYMTTITGVAGDRYEWPRVGGTTVREYSDTRHKIKRSDIRFGKRSMFYRKGYNDIPLSEDEVEDMKNLPYNFALIREKQSAAFARFADEVALGVEEIKQEVEDENGRTTLVGTGEWRVKNAEDADGFCGGILGTNYVGQGGMDKVNLDLTYGGKNLIPVDYASTGTGISDNLGGTFFDKILLLKQILQEKEVYRSGASDSIVIAISPYVKRILHSYEMTLNSDYYGFGKMREDGNMSYNEALNVNFIVTNMLPMMDTVDKNNADVTGCRMCTAWLKHRVGFGVWKNPSFELLLENTEVDVRHSSLAKGKFGATRLDEDTVFVLPVKEERPLAAAGSGGETDAA